MISNYTFADLIKKPLTERQFEILQLVASTYSKKEIAKIMTISEKTVEGHIDCITERIKTDWTPATSTKMQRLTLIWEYHKTEIADFSNVELLPLDELLNRISQQIGIKK